MDVEWCEERLREYLDLLDTYETSGRRYGPGWRELEQSYPVVRGILRSLDPESQEFNLDTTSYDFIRRTVLQSLGILEAQAVLKSKLAPDAPVLVADRMHPWAWDAARPFLEIQQFRQALHASAKAINAQLQVKVGRRDISDDQLIQECFSERAPEPGKPRLRIPGDLTDQTVQSRQRGTAQLALGCIWAIRNPATHLAAHDAGELDEQEALEQLATLSTLARLLDECEVLTADEK